MAKRASGQRPPDSSTSFAPEPIRRIAEVLDGLPGKQRALAQYMLQHPEKVGFLSVRELAERVGVSIATVSRFCAQLGYGGYDEFGRQVQQSLQYEMSTPARLRALNPGGDAAERSPFEQIVDMEIDNLLTLRRGVRPQDMARCVEWLNEAGEVFVVGSMGATTLAEYLAYAASKVRKSVHLVSSAGGTPNWLALSNAGPGSLVFLLGFPRYQRSTVSVGEFAKRRGARIVAITDQHVSPLAALADLTFAVSISFSTVVDSFAAPVAFVHALVGEYTERYRADVTRHLLDFEQYTGDLGIWVKPPEGGRRRG